MTKKKNNKELNEYLNKLAKDKILVQTPNGDLKVNGDIEEKRQTIRGMLNILSKEKGADTNDELNKIKEQFAISNEEINSIIKNDPKKWDNHKANVEESLRQLEQEGKIKMNGERIQLTDEGTQMAKDVAKEVGEKMQSIDNCKMCGMVSKGEDLTDGYCSDCIEKNFFLMEKNIDKILPILKDLAMAIPLPDNPLTPHLFWHGNVTGNVLSKDKNKTPSLLTITEKNKEEVMNFYLNLIKQRPRSWMIYVQSPYFMTVLDLIKPYLDKREFSMYLEDCWTQMEFPHQEKTDMLIELFNEADKNYLMNNDDKTVYDAIPEKLTIYRGVQGEGNKKTIKGLSWTIDLKKAKWFANRFSQNNPVYKAEIDKKYIFMFNNSRNENEVVVNPKHLKNLEISIDSIKDIPDNINITSNNDKKIDLFKGDKLFYDMVNTVKGLHNIKGKQDEVMDVLGFLNKNFGLSYTDMLSRMKDYVLDETLSGNEVADDVINYLYKDYNGENENKVLDDWHSFQKRKIIRVVEFLTDVRGMSKDVIQKSFKAFLDKNADYAGEAIGMSISDILYEIGGEDAKKDIENFTQDFEAYFQVREIADNEHNAEFMFREIKRITANFFKNTSYEIVDLDKDIEAFQNAILQKDITYENLIGKIFDTIVESPFNKNSTKSEFDNIVKQIYEEMEKQDWIPIFKTLISSTNRLNNISVKKVSFKDIINYLNLTKTTAQMEKMKASKDSDFIMPDAVKRGDLSIHEWLGEPTNHDIHLKILNVPENDRLKNYQMMVKHLYRAGNKSWRLYDGDALNEDEEIQFIKEGLFDGLVEPIILKSYPYDIEDDVVVDIVKEMNAKVSFEDVFLPYSFMAVDCPFYLEDRKYLGFFLFDATKIKGFDIERESTTSRYDEFSKYVIITIYAKVDKYSDDPEPESKLFIDMFDLNTKTYTKADKKDVKLQNECRKFVTHFLIYMNQKELVFLEHPYSEKNAERRKERGLLPIPAYRTIRVSGKLEVYQNKYREWRENPQSRRKPRYKFTVPNHKFFFLNKHRYRRIYAMDDEQLKKHGYAMDTQKNPGFIYCMIKEHSVGDGPEPATLHKVVKD